jgi:predicted thioesterase
MILLMETFCFNVLQTYREDGEITVGIAIHVEHRAASGIGMHIRAHGRTGIVRRTLLHHARYGTV